MSVVNTASENAESASDFGELQRFLAVCADAASRTRVELAAIWQELAQGQALLVDHFFTHDRCYAALRSLRESHPRSRTIAKDGNALECVLLGSGDDRANAEQELREMGVEGGPENAPLLLVMAVHAFRHRAGTGVAHLSELEHQGVVFRIVGAERPDLALSELLDGAELEHTRLMIEGRSAAVIAARSGTSVDEVENRLATALAKLGVKDRLELLQKLVQGS